MPTLLDTHVWVWWVTNDRRLSKKAADAVHRAAASDGVWLSVISIWEVAKKVERAQLVTRDRNLRTYPHVQTVW